MPKHPQTYIHRIGRSGRFGRKGLAINYVVSNEMNILSNIQKTYNTHILHVPKNLQSLNQN
jgi:superfamily II DNA/RNA helicase